MIGKQINGKKTSQKTNRKTRQKETIKSSQREKDSLPSKKQY